MYLNIIWIPGWWLLIPFLILGTLLFSYFTKNQPNYGPSDTFITSILPGIFSWILSASIILGVLYLLSLIGLEFGIS